jgi:uncharacterized protein with gpF-like domain
VKTLPVVHPNAGIEAEYRRKLWALIEEMTKSVAYWVGAAYKANEPVVAKDELPAETLRRAVAELAARWQKQFDEAAEKLAKYYAQSANVRTAQALERILDDAGMTVEFKMTRAARDVMNATINEQIGLIRSIPQQYFTDVEGLVMRSVTAGRDLGPLYHALIGKVDLKRIGKGRKPGESDRSIMARTKRRAAMIARDQNNKATASMTRVRYIELGVEEAIWVHSGGGKEPRPSHLAAGRRQQRYNVKEGWYDPDEGKHILPGELINCRCVPRAVIPGFV